MSLLGKQARTVASKMRPDGGEVTIAPLRQLEHWCERYLLLASEPADQFAMFFLSTLIHDVFFNLAGDLAYDEAAEARKREYFAELAGELSELGAALEKDNSAETTRFHEMVASYMRAVASINQMATDDERGK